MPTFFDQHPCLSLPRHGIHLRPRHVGVPGCLPDFYDCFSRGPVERDAGNDTLDFTGLRVALTFFDSPRKDDIFEIEDGEVFIF